MNTLSAMNFDLPRKISSYSALAGLLHKKLFFLCTGILISVASFSQNNSTGKLPMLPLLMNKIVYIDTVRFDSSYTKERLFNNARKWYRANFETSDNTLTIDNSSDGEINGTGIIHDKEKQIDPKDVFFTIDLVALKGAYAYRIYDIAWMEHEIKFYFSDMYNEELYPLPKPHWPEQYRQDMLMNMNDKINQMLAHLKESLAKSRKS